MNQKLSLNLSSDLENLTQRMSKPQRHRLLHGFPMSSGMVPLQKSIEETLAAINLDLRKKLAVCIIPHPYCNPQVKGCGYCTFPHELFSRKAEMQSTQQVANEIRLWKSIPGLIERPVQSIYIGGGTANLMSKDSWKAMVAAMRDTLHFVDPSTTELPTEITYEGVATYFTESRLREYAKDFSDCRKRVSFGIQTFSKRQLKAMGRSSFNNKLADIIQCCHELDIAISGDFLFNLPGQSQQEIKEDVKEAIELGFDQVCWYNLVCYSGLGTQWSNDQDIMNSLPSIEEGLQNWLTLHEFLKEQGFIETSVTNFRHKNNHEGRFLYEENVRMPWDYDWLGAGVTAISTLSNWDLMQGVKIQNPQTFAEYDRRSQTHKLPWNTEYTYQKRDLQILYLTRVLKSNYICAAHYHQIFNSQVLEDFSCELEACIKTGGLISKGDDFILTPKGAYYLDSIMGLIANKRVKQLRSVI